ncbi:MAG TPA: L-serine ammonia-lyase [Candidatus Saccharimonadales bacterium]|jgi:L-serine dehydratase|nr:L-serine ammonia-lyase [Candidatus Saccharimonadales bacterium]
MISIFDLFKIGIGPSSSHTVGPMRAARMFLEETEERNCFEQIAELKIELFGSLALTGRGHGTDRAILLGLMGHKPDEIDPSTVEDQIDAVRCKHTVSLLGRRAVAFDEDRNLLFHGNQVLPRHSNGMRFTALDAQGKKLSEEVYYSVGGGFVVKEGQSTLTTEGRQAAYPFKSGDELLAMANGQGMTIASLVLANEKCWRTEAEIHDQIRKIWQVMQACVQRGVRNGGSLPGGLNVQRRASSLHSHLLKTESQSEDPLDVMDWINVYALATNEENAAGGQVVTAPTNGAAGIIPAVLHYYQRFCKGASENGIFAFFLTAGAIGILYKENASISGAEVGCQGEVGVACSMAAAGLVAALGGTNEQMEHAAEIGMEHHLGMTCDPVGGLVQIPCIERNALGAMKAINAARMATRGNGTHQVSLDQVIKTMYQTGLDMQSRYKETSLGGLAIHVVEC